MTAAAETGWLDAVRWGPDGLAPAIAQEVATGRVLTLAWMNREALRLTLKEGRAVYWSRSRGRLWRKGEQSGHVQELREVRLDCDADAILLQVKQRGGIACHTGRASCFYLRHTAEGWREAEAVLKDPATIYGGDGASAARTEPAATDIIDKLAQIIAARKAADPEVSYVASLRAQGTTKILEKIEEEAGELIEAAKAGNAPDITHETADLWFHSLVLLVSLDIAPAQVLAELERRFGVSGHAEKASRKS